MFSRDRFLAGSNCRYGFKESVEGRNKDFWKEIGRVKSKKKDSGGPVAAKNKSHPSHMNGACTRSSYHQSALPHETGLDI